MNYNYSSFTNTNQIFNHEKSDLKNKYNVYEFNLNENHKKEQKRKLSNIYLNSPIENKNNRKYNNINNNNNTYGYNNKNYNTYNFQPSSAQKKRSGKMKRVKFNEKVCVINVESYKEYNKIDDDICVEDLYKRNFNDNYSKIPKNNNKKEKDCECDIF